MTREFKKFDETMRKLVSVSHDDLKAKLEAQKKTKKNVPPRNTKKK
jgi:hypothetical protein